MKDGKAFIERTLCYGCSLCEQVCPFDAISQKGGAL
ncbi:MAG: 4Fe-4S binding protein [Candidatus Weimeria sp.]